MATPQHSIHWFAIRLAVDDDVAHALALGLTDAIELDFDRASALIDSRGVARLYLDIDTTRTPALTHSRAPARARVLTRARALAQARASARVLDQPRDWDRSAARNAHLSKLRGAQLRFRAELVNYLKTTLPAVGPPSLPYFQCLIDFLQLLNDRLEGKAEPVEVIALVRRERARK